MLRTHKKFTKKEMKKDPLMQLTRRGNGFFRSGMA